MKFYGLQKMTLLDYPGKVACTIFTGGCNFRCPFCHNALLVTEIDESFVYDESEILEFLDKRKGLLDGVCVTGGEPLIQNGIEDFLLKVREKGFSIKLDTNGYNPERLKSIVNKGLVDYVAVDIKNSKQKYAVTAGVKNFDLSLIEKTVDFLKQGAVDYEFRTTVVQEFHNIQDIVDISLWLKGAKRYFLQRFVDSGNLISGGLSAISPEIMLKMRDEARKNLPETETRGIYD